jgi:hypothetical protein
MHKLAIAVVFAAAALVLPGSAAPARAQVVSFSHSYGVNPHYYRPVRHWRHRHYRRRYYRHFYYPRYGYYYYRPYRYYYPYPYSYRRYYRPFPRFFFGFCW